MTITAIGKIGDTEVHKITLRGPGALQATVLTYGARLAGLLVPDRKGQVADVIVGHDHLSDWQASTTYASATCGRYSNRIGKAQFWLDGQHHVLTPNEGENQLHGGPDGFDRKVWRVTAQEAGAVTLQTRSPAGEMGYPGDLLARVIYRFDADGRLWIEMLAETSAPTVVNMVNHAYYNLAGAGSGSVLNHQLQVSAQHYTPVGTDLIPTGQVLAVQGTAFDFTTLRPIGQTMPGPMGFDHNFCLSEPLRESGGRLLRVAARLQDPASGRQMVLSTNQPGLQVYSGGYMDDSLPGKAGGKIGQFGGIALETQSFPDTPNQPHFPPARLDPGHTYHHIMALDLAPLPG